MATKSRNILKELLSTGSGKVGVFFFAVMVAISVFVVFTYPLDFGTKYWSNPVIWADNPRVAPPSWTNLFSSHRQAETVVLESGKPTARYADESSTRAVYIFELNYSADESPTFTSVAVQNVSYVDRPPILIVNIERPDSKEIELYRISVSGPRLGETAPFVRYSETPFRAQLSGEAAVASDVSRFLNREFNVSISSQDLFAKGIDKVVFGTPLSDGGFNVLKGVYKIRIDAQLFSESDNVEKVKFVVGGSVFGLMGTDSLGRDLSVGLLFGFPVALFIGLVASTITTGIGTFMGIVSGYIGGKTDTAIQRFSDVLANIPLLPILIFLSFTLGQKLWVVILVMVAFSWPGLSILVRSMVLQIRSGYLVEATVALGASRIRVMFKHIFPQTAPFVFSQLIFFTPSAILAEAALSFLGLGDPSIPTWGQILEYGFKSGGIYLGYWWWVLPPGLLVVFTAMIFVFLALGMEPIINPRLKRVK